MAMGQKHAAHLAKILVDEAGRQAAGRIIKRIRTEITFGRSYQESFERVAEAYGDATQTAAPEPTPLEDAIAAEEATQATSEDDLSKHSVQELRQLAKELGVKGSSTMKKADLIAELEEAIS